MIITEIAVFIVAGLILITVGIYYTVKLWRKHRGPSMDVAMIAALTSSAQNMIYVRLLRAICMELASWTLSERKGLSDKTINLLTQLSLCEDGTPLLDILEELRHLNGKEGEVRPTDIDLDPTAAQFLAAIQEELTDSEDQ